MNDKIAIVLARRGSSSQGTVPAALEAKVERLEDKITDIDNNIVLVQDEQPTEEENVIWIPETTTQDVVVPSYAEHQALETALQETKETVDILAKDILISSPSILQQICATERIGDYLEIGDVITIPWTDNTGNSPVEYQFPFVVVNIADCYDEHDVLHKNALWLMAMYAEPQEIIFDAAEGIAVDLTEEPKVLENWYYWGKTGNTYTELNLSTGDDIPTTYDSVHKCAINHVHVLQYGYNRWSMSAYRQWLNSDAPKNTGWWTSQHFGDVAPAASMTNKPGWLAGFTAEWRAIFKPVKVETACNTVTDGGVVDTTYDTFFLPSLEQMYGTPQAPGVEGEYWPYWKTETGLEAPTNGSSSDTNEARKIPSIANPAGNAVYCRLRSANRSYSHSVWYVGTGGYLNNSNANSTYRSLPACVIY